MLRLFKYILKKQYNIKFELFQRVLFSVNRFSVLTLKTNKHVTYKILSQILPVNEHVTKRSTRN